MNSGESVVIMGFPVDPSDRAKLAALCPLDLPRAYTDSVVMRCESCDIRIWIGPRSLAMVALGARPTCVLCAVQMGDVRNVISLGNPESVLPSR